MANRLHQVVSTGTLNPPEGPPVPVVLPHLINVNGVPHIPDRVFVDAPGVTVTAVTATTVTVVYSGDGEESTSANIWLEYFHTVERVFGAIGLNAPAETHRAAGATNLLPDPFIVYAGAAVVTEVPPAPSAAMFFGTTTGTGSLGNDYAATVAVQTAAGTGRVPFPRDGAAVGADITRSAPGEITILTTGIYEVSWMVGFVEPSQLQVSLNDVGIASTCNISGAGTQINSNSVILSLAATNRLSLINPPGNAAALTVQPADGSRTHAQAPSFLIKRIS